MFVKCEQRLMIDGQIKIYGVYLSLIYVVESACMHKHYVCAVHNYMCICALFCVKKLVENAPLTIYQDIKSETNWEEDTEVETD